MLNYLYLIVIVLWVGLLIGVILKESLLRAMMGMGLVFISLFVIQEGLGGYNNDATQVFAILTLFTGLTYFILDGLEQIENLRF